MHNAISNVTDLISHRASATADATAFHFVRSDESSDSLTYGELQRQVWRVSAMLADAGLQPGDRVLVSAPPGLDYVAAFLGSLHAGCVAVPAYPPRGSRHDDRLAAIVRDAAPAVALGTAESRGRAQRGGRLDIAWRTIDEALEFPADDRPMRTAPDGVAFLQYTSGSTGTPKGVIVPHRALLANIEMIAQNFALSDDDVAVSWLPPYHDMGLVGGLLTPLFAGIPCALMAPVSFAQQPVSWLRAITRFRATVSGGPDFAYRQCVDRISDEDLSEVDLSSWRLAFTGAEPVRARTIRQFTQRFQQYGFAGSAMHPCYGLAEATLIVAGAPAGERVVTRAVDPQELARHRVVAARGDVARGDGVELVSSGRPLCPVRVVTPDGGATTDVGEIWVGGDSIADGYWGRPEESAATFAHSFLRTGDLGFLADGELFVTGRVKDVIIVRGRNLYPQDIEDHVAAAHSGLAGGAVVAFAVSGRSDEDGDGLAVAVEVDRHAGAVEVQAMLDRARQAVVEGSGVAPAVMVAVPRATLPRTSSGKMQRGLTRRLFEAGELATIAGVAAMAESVDSELDPAVCEAAREVLGETPADVPLTRLGLDSLAAARFVAAAQQRGVHIDLEELLSGATLAGLTVTQSVQAARSETSTAKAFWLHEQMVPGTPAYTTAAAVRLPSDLAVARLEGALRRLLERHPLLRSRFAGPEPTVVVDPIPEQILQLEEEVVVEALDGRLTELSSVPLPMAEGNLVRAKLIGVRAADPVLLLLAHHAVVDLWSAAVLLSELDAFYQGRELPPPVVAAASGREPDPGEVTWWRERLAGIADRAELPTDHPVPTTPSHRGRTLRRTAVADLGELARSCAATRFAAQLGAAALLIARHSGHDDVVIGVPLANRDLSQVDAVGCLVSVVPVRIDLSKAVSVRDAVEATRDALAASVARAHLPLSELASLAGAGRHPLFDVAVVDHGRQLPVSVNGLVREVLPLDRGGAAFDLSLLFGPDCVELEYTLDRFRDGTVARLGDHLVTLLDGMIRWPDHPWSTLPIDDTLPSYQDMRERAAARKSEQASAIQAGDRDPSGRWEEAVARAFDEVLGYGPVAAGDDFFDFGGNSLAAAQAAGRLAAELGVEVTVRDVYEASTVAALAQALQSRPPVALAPVPIQRQPRRAEVSAR